MKQKLATSLCAVAACLALGEVHAQSGTSESVVITGKRANRVSKGATGLPMELKETPQTITTIDKEDLADYGLAGSNDALRLGTGINVEQYETNRAVFNSRGFEIQLTQIDGLGMSNDWGTVVGQLDTFLFERIELIRGANGLLTGVGNSSGTINYVRKRPGNRDTGQVVLSAGSYDQRRGALDYNKVLTDDGAWAGRLVVAADDKDSHLRALHDRRATVYGVVDGQVGRSGVLTVGVTLQDARQQSPMWGSLTLHMADGGQAAFDRSSSTSQDWTYWNTSSRSVFVEYAHSFGDDWEGKLSYNRGRGEEDTKLFYAFPSGAGLNADHTGLIGWPYRGFTVTNNELLDANVSGSFSAWGLKHRLLSGVSHSRLRTATDVYNYDAAVYRFLPLPAFPYGGAVYPEPAWEPRAPSSGGRQALTRVYVASQLGLTARAKAVLGLNAIKLRREGASLYGADATGDSPKLDKLSPYAGLTYDFTPEVMGYLSYSDIFQNQSQTDFNGYYLAPTKGVNIEAGAKAEWLGRKLLSTFAVFSSEQKGLATQGAGLTPGNQFWYFPTDVDSRGFEFETTGRLGRDSRLTLGFTHLRLKGADGNDIYEWVPRKTLNARFDTRVLPKLRAGATLRWQSDTYRVGGPRQAAFPLVHAFAAYELTEAATLRLNVNNVFDRTYIGGLAYGAIYGAPRNGTLTLDYKL